MLLGSSLCRLTGILCECLSTRKDDLGNRKWRIDHWRNCSRLQKSIQGDVYCDHPSSDWFYPTNSSAVSALHHPHQIPTSTSPTSSEHPTLFDAFNFIHETDLHNITSLLLRKPCTVKKQADISQICLHLMQMHKYVLNLWKGFKYTHMILFGRCAQLQSRVKGKTDRAIAGKINPTALKLLRMFLTKGYPTRANLVVTDNSSDWYTQTQRVLVERYKIMLAFCLL